MKDDLSNNRKNEWLPILSLQSILIFNNKQYIAIDDKNRPF